MRRLCCGISSGCCGARCRSHRCRSIRLAHRLPGRAAMIVRLVSMAVVAAVVVAGRVTVVVVMLAALAVGAGGGGAMGVVPAAVVVAPSAVVVPLTEADARRLAVAVIRSGRRLRATRRLAAAMPTAIKAAVPATVTGRAMATGTASLVTRRDMTRGGGRAKAADTLTVAGTGMMPGVAVITTVVPLVL